MLIDPYTTWVIGHEHRDDLLREAQAAQVAASMPHQPSALRMRLSAWLYALAARLEPSSRTEPFSRAPQAQAHAR
jgi:hypothetical protein